MLKRHAIKGRIQTQATKGRINDISKSSFSSFYFVFSKDKTICNSFVKGFISNVLVKHMVAEMIYAF